MSGLLVRTLDWSPISGDIADESTQFGCSSVLGRQGILKALNFLMLNKKDKPKFQKALDTLIRYQKTDHANCTKLPPGQEILAHCYELQLHNQESRAREIIGLLRVLDSRLDPKAAGTILSVLQLLSHLSSVPSKRSRLEPEFIERFPFASVLKDNSYLPVNLAKQPRNNPFLDQEEDVTSQHVTPYDKFENWSKFELKKETKYQNPYQAISSDIMFQSPGSGLKFWPKLDKHLDKPLNIPPLSLVSSHNGRALRIPRENSRFEQEEEFYSIKNEEKVEIENKEEKIDIWENIWEVEVPQRRTWEMLGQIEVEREKPFLTETKGQSVHNAWIVAMENLKLVDPNCKMVPELVVLPDDQLVKDLAYLMIGIASDNFVYESSSDSFRVKYGICSKELTPESFEKYSRNFLECGSIARRLEKMCCCEKNERELLISRMGLVYVGFLNGISKYLQAYRTMILNLSKNRNLIELSSILHPLSNQIKFLGNLCRVDRLEDDNFIEEEFPTGIQLLCYLFDKTIHIHAKDLYFVFVSILRSASAPYFRYLEKWIFQGTFYDEYKEFGLQCNSNFLNFRNRIFWTSAYTTIEFGLDSSICRGGNFISEIQHQVYSCGKSLALLKLCQPSNHLCVSRVEFQPHVRLLVSPLEQRKLKMECDAFVLHMNNLAELRTLTLAQIKDRETEQKKDLLRIAHKKHKETLDRLRQERKSFMEKEKKRKQKIFKDLKDQFLAEQKRKDEEKEKKKSEDRKFAEMAKRKEEEEMAREDFVRAEMEAKYERMTKEAEVREQRARWRIQRMELRGERIKFWREENKKLAELVKNKEINDLNNKRKMNTLILEESQLDATTKKVVGPNNWKRIRVEEDEMNNIVLILGGQESNVVQRNLKNFHDFSFDTRQTILSQPFETLSTFVQEKILDISNSNTSEVEEESSNENNFRRNPLRNSSSKRKRPSSFVESNRTPKRKEVEEFFFSSSLAATLDSPHDIGTVRMRKKHNSTPKKRDSNTVIDGRKRPTSKSIEEVLYPSRFSKSMGDLDEISKKMSVLRTEFKIAEGPRVKPYDTKIFNESGKHFSSHKKCFSSVEENISSETWFDDSVMDQRAFTPLTLLMENSILIPLRAQLAVVNKAVLTYLLVDANLMGHFRALRSYLLFHDGEFAHHLSYSLFNQVQESSSQIEVMNPATLNRIVENALMSSTLGCKDELSQNVGFSFVDFENSLTHTDAIASLKLSYKTEWPANLILTQEVVETYGEIFQFLLQLKKAVWGLEQVCNDLKCLRPFASQYQIRKVHIMRHEMLNFVNVTQEYVKTQVLGVSWTEFEKDISENVDSVDSLYEAHVKYLNKAVKRSILSKKAKVVHKVIIDLFNIIAKFSFLLTSNCWEEKIKENSSLKILEHPAFAELEETYGIFQDYSAFLFSVVNKLAMRGYEHHLNSLLLNLNFNGIYDSNKAN